jgi:hypothetical protein
VVKGKVTRADQSPLFTKVILNTACEPKPMAMPQCEAVDLIPAAPATPAPAAP